nr:uncharacterized protein LOC129261413 [Lytechinus pictus]
MVFTIQVVDPSTDTSQQDATPPSFNSLFDPPSTDTSQQDYNMYFWGIGHCFWRSFFSIPLAMVAIGSVYIHECPAQHFIPLYLIVMGLATIFKVLIDQKARFQRSRLPRRNRRTSHRTHWRKDSASLLDCSSLRGSSPEIYGSTESSGPTPRTALAMTTATQRSTSLPSG